MNKNSKIYIAGHRGMVGSAILRNLQARGYNNLITREFSQLNLLHQSAVEKFFKEEKPEYVIDAAAKVGGIWANNTYRAQFLYENLQIQNNLIHFAHEVGVKKLLFLGSSCIYPKFAAQPMKEEYLLTGELESTNEPYAIAKIAGIKMCEAYRDQYGDNFISVMPTNLYGPNDNFDLETSHVLPALIRKIHLAKLLENSDFEGIRRDLLKHPLSHTMANSENVSEAEINDILEKFGIIGRRNQNQGKSEVTVKLWGSGTPKREFLHVDDMANACVHLMLNYDGKQFVNIGVGEDLSIRALAEMIQEIVGFTGGIEWDTTKPDGTPRKLLDVSRLHSLGWKAHISLKEGIKKTYEWYVKGNTKYIVENTKYKIQSTK